MIARLAAIAETAKPDSGHNNHEAIEQIRANLGRAASPQQECVLRQLLAFQFLLIGRNDEAIEQFTATQQLLATLEGDAPKEARDKLHINLAIAYLRVAEQDNCISEHNCASCLLPIKPGSAGVHRNQRGARKAIEECLAFLEHEPDDIVARWLMNVAFMTVGEYPDKVPERWLIPESVFASDIEFPRFYDVAPHLGVDGLGLAGGTVVEDFDRDGFLDIIVSSSGLVDQLRFFRNDGKGKFEDWTERAGLTGLVGGLNISHADYNNDGYPDVLVLRGGWQKEEGRQPNSLLKNNGNGTFEDVTEAAGLLSFRPCQTGAWGDFDGDGWLDLFIGNEPVPPYGMPCELYRNNQDGTFTECAERLKVDPIGVCKGATWGDYNNDGRPDLFISRNGQTNLLYRNDGPAPQLADISEGIKKQRNGQPWWIFTEVSEFAGVTEPVWSFPCWFWDYNNDGWEDLMVFGYDQREPQLQHVAADYLGLPHQGALPRLYRNTREGTFEDVTEAAGLNKVLLAMGCNFGDLDNDGWLDFYVGTGDPDFRTLIPNRMFRNDGGVRFQDVTTAGGFGHLQKGHGIAFADIDNDGDQDVYANQGGLAIADVAHRALFENPGFGRQWITLELEGKQSNRFGVGARIRIELADAAGRRSIFRTVGTGGSFGSNPLRQELGLGQASTIKQLEITWPVTGKSDVFHDVPANQFLTIREGDGTPRVQKRGMISLSPSRGREPPPDTCCEPKK